jgi:hypothetical protein
MLRYRSSFESDFQEPRTRKDSSGLILLSAEDNHVVPGPKSKTHTRRAPTTKPARLPSGLQSCHAREVIGWARCYGNSKKDSRATDHGRLSVIPPRCVLVYAHSSGALVQACASHIEEPST